MVFLLTQGVLSRSKLCTKTLLKQKKQRRGSRFVHCDVAPQRRVDFKGRPQKDVPVCRVPNLSAAPETTQNLHIYIKKKHADTQSNTHMSQFTTSVSGLFPRCTE